jgi:hypothetical protein
MPPKRKGYHCHHKIPKHMGGSDDDSNIVYLTPEEHALAHFELYEKYGRYEDAQAFNTLSSQWLNGRTIDGYKQNKEHIQKRISSIDYSKVSAKLKGRKSPTLGMKFEYKPKPKISDAQRGKPKSEETKKRVSEGLRTYFKHNPVQRFYCILCREPVTPSRIDRHGPKKKACK